MVKSATNKPRRLILLALTFIFVAALGATFYWVYQRGLTREGLFDRAQRAYREARYDDAIQLVTETRAAEPENLGARELLIESLIAADRTDEARKESDRLLKEQPESTFAAVKLCQFALQDSNVSEAERLARHLADRKPDFAYQVLALIQDPFAGEAPTFVRVIRFSYRFTTPEERASSGDWWIRERIGSWSPDMRLRKPVMTHDPLILD